MKTKRLNNIISKLNENDISQMLICDPASIFYLTGRMINPGERFYALLIKNNGEHKIFINSLFTVPEDIGVEKIWFSDEQDACEIASKYIDKDKILGVDKNLPARFLLRLMELDSASGYKNTSACVDTVRSCKDDEEIVLMREASRVNDEAMAELKTRVRDGMNERELASQLKEIYARMGAYEYSFDPLVGFGKCAAIGHYEAGNTKLREGDCILIDMGCIKNGYCSDMTRTFFYKKVSDEHRKVYETVLKAQKAAEAMIKPGVRFCDIDKTARDIITQAGYGDKFTHRLGHSIGIECHEYGDVSSVNENVVQEGMIFSIEPGIYLEDDMGVRIEDLVLVTHDGVEILNHYNKELQIID